MGQGVIQNFDAYRDVTSLESVSYTQPKLDAAGQPLKDAQGNVLTETLTTQTQTLAMGPVASQEAIKMVGTNGGGFFNANSAHPFENPTPLSNFLQMIAMFLIPAALCFTFGRMVGDSRQGWAVFGAMTALFVVWRWPPWGPRGRAIPCSRPWGWIRRIARFRPAETWRVRSRASASSPRRCSPHHHRRVLRRGERHA